MAIEASTTTTIESKVFTKDQVVEHCKANPDGLFLVIHDKLYDVTKFADEHPGGEETLKDMQIRDRFVDATESFEDVGHSMDARDILKKHLVGSLESNKPQVKVQETKSIEESSKEKKAPLNTWIIVVAIGLVAVGIAYFLNK